MSLPAWHSAAQHSTAACYNLYCWPPSQGTTTHPCLPLPAGSAKGKAILADWSNALQKFWQLVPPSEANSPQASKAADEAAQAGGVAGGVAVAASA